MTLSLGKLGLLGMVGMDVSIIQKVKLLELMSTTKLKYLIRHVQVPTSAGGVVSIIMPRLLFMEWR